MIRFQIPLVLVMTSCCATVRAPDAGTTPWARCYTPCGMRANDGDCASLQRYEQRVVTTLARVVPEWREEKICAALKGYEVKVEQHGDRALDATCSDEGWYSGACGGCVIGCTETTPRTISIGKDDWEHSALAHEIVHVADNGRSGHCPWKSAKLKAALYELAGFVDPSDAGPECSH